MKFELPNFHRLYLTNAVVMPVEGLPSAAESVLNALLKDHHETSFKLEGRGKSNIFVLRLTPFDRTAIAAVNTVTYKKKPPSQLRRDRQRAEARKAAVMQQPADETVSSPTPLFFPTPPNPAKQHMHIDRDLNVHDDNTSDTHHCYEPARVTRPCEIVNTATNGCVAVQGTTSDSIAVEETETQTNGSCREETAVSDVGDAMSFDTDPENRSVLDSDVIKEYVGTFMNRNLQNRLRDKDRNKCL